MEKVLTINTSAIDVDCSNFARGIKGASSSVLGVCFPSHSSCVVGFSTSATNSGDSLPESVEQFLQEQGVGSSYSWDLSDDSVMSP